MQVIEIVLEEEEHVERSWTWGLLLFECINNKKGIRVSIIVAQPKEKELIKLLFLRGMFRNICEYEFMIYHKRKIIQILEIINILYGKTGSVQFLYSSTFKYSPISSIELFRIINRYLYE